VVEANNVFHWADTRRIEGMAGGLGGGSNAGRVPTVPFVGFDEKCRNHTEHDRVPEPHTSQSH